MTLVVAKLDKTFRKVKIFSDTRITNDVKKEHSKLFEGVVKTIIYTPGICISYAGSNVSAEEIHKSIFGTNHKLDIKTLFQVLLKFHIHRNCDIEFLISNIYNNTLAFIKISGGKAEPSNTTSWIEDIDGFSLFQKEFHQLSNGKDVSKQFDFAEKAFKNVILNTNVSTIGGVPIVVERTRFGFQYAMKAMSILGRDITINSKNGKGVPLNFGSAKEGSFNFSYLVSKNPKTPAIGIHYFDGKFGVFSYPEKSRQFQIYNNVEVEEFIKIVNKEHQIILGGMIIINGGMMMK